MSESVVLASVYRTHAVNFWMSAKQLGENMEVKEDGTPAKLTAIPYYFLVSHAMELFLKAALLKRGWSDADLRRYKYRHDIGVLLRELKAGGLDVSDRTTKVVDGMSPQHKSSALRYTVFLDDSQKSFFPTREAVEEVLQELLLLTKISAQGK